MKESLNVIDLFCGAGGLSYGFKKAGFNIILGVDNNEIALKTFRMNHPETEILIKDISKVKRKDILDRITGKKVDVIIGGPPCQGFSLAGKRNPRDPRNFLIKKFLNVVSEIQPEIFVIENVPGLLSMKNSHGKNFIDKILKKSKKMGYFLNIKILRADEYGIPQKRRRIFIVGSKKKMILDIEKEQAISLKEVLLKRKEVSPEYFYSEKMIAGFKRREKINKELKRGFGWQFLDLKKPSYTISARYYKDGAEALVKYSEKEIRKLTTEECARIQSFPREYKFDGSKKEVYRQIGNAVPPQLSLKVAKAIFKSLENGRRMEKNGEPLL